MYPAEPGQGFVFEDKIVGGVIPREYIAPVEQGIKEALENGVLAGYPMVDVAVQLVYGSYHDVDSSEMAFKIAGSMAYKEAAKKANPVLLEPMMNVEVVSSRGVHGRRAGRSLGSARQDRRYDAAWRSAGDRLERSAVGDVRVLDEAAVNDAGSRRVLDGVRALRGSAEVQGGRDHQQGEVVSLGLTLRGSTTMAKAKFERTKAARERRHDRPRRPWQDDVDGRPDEDLVGQGDMAPKYISYDEVAKASASQGRRDATKILTIATSHVEYETPNRHYAHVDCPGTPTT
jgi:hypothetical protein